MTADDADSGRKADHVQRPDSPAEREQLKRAVIATRIREARRLAGLSQGQVARLLDVHRPTISEMEAGNRRVSADEVTRLAELFDVSVSWLMGEGAETADVNDTRIQLAARELSKLKPDALARLMEVLTSMRDESSPAAEHNETSASPDPKSTAQAPPAASRRGDDK